MIATDCSALLKQLIIRLRVLHILQVEKNKWINGKIFCKNPQKYSMQYLLFSDLGVAPLQTSLEQYGMNL